MAEEKKVSCMMCLLSCGLLATVENGKVVEVSGDPESFSQGFICPKAKLGAIEFLYHPDRVNYPLKRVGARGEGKWARISWDEALDEVAAKLTALKEEFGPETLVVTTGHGESSHDAVFPYGRFENIFGTPNLICSGAFICGSPDFNGAIATIGFASNAEAVPNPVKNKCLLMWGKHPIESYSAAWPAIRAAKSMGSKLVVIDPRFTEEAGEADLWLQPRPGSDGALAMAMVNYIIQNELYDQEFVAKWTVGFDELKEKVKNMTLEKAEEITWVPAEKIASAATIYATNKPGFAMWGITLSQQGRATTANSFYQRALMILTGNVDVDGGERLFTQYSRIAVDEWTAPDRLPRSQRQKAIGYDRFKFLCWAARDAYDERTKRVLGRWFPSNGWTGEAHGPSVFRTILSEKPYPIKAMITQGNNIFGSHANTRLVHEALKKLDLFVMVDPFMTPAAELADYVFPPACILERDVFQNGFGMSAMISGFEKAVEPLYERKSDTDFWILLGKKLGLDKDDWPEDQEDLYNKMLANTGMTFKELCNRKPNFDAEFQEEKSYEKTGFATPSGKAELASGLAKELGYDPVPDFEEPFWSPVSSPELLEEYPLILTTGARNVYYFFTQHRQLPSVRSRDPWPHVQIHPETARELGIGDGQWVYIETPKGRIRQLAKYDSSIHPRVVNAEFDWWYPEEPGEEPFLHGVYKSNVNVMLDDDPDHAGVWTGSDSRRAALCKVYPVPDYTHVPSYANR